MLDINKACFASKCMGILYRRGLHCYIELSCMGVWGSRWSSFCSLFILYVSTYQKLKKLRKGVAVKASFQVGMDL